MIIVKKNKKYKVFYKNDNLRELQRRLEEFAFEHILTYEVQPERYFKKSKSGYYKTHKFGYFMVAGCDKITIYNKHISNGYLYNSTVVDKIATYILIRPKQRKNLAPIEVEDFNQKIDYFESVHKELINAFDKKKPKDIVCV